MNGWTKRIAIVAAAMLATACSGNPSAGDASVMTGSLGNGGFIFQCDDGAECRRWSSSDAAKFPKDGVALGSTFRIRYLRNDEFRDDLDIFTNKRDSEGITLRGLAPYFGGTPGDRILAQTKAGYGTIVAQTAAGGTADFISLRVVKPDKLIVLDAGAGNSVASTEIEKLDLTRAQNRILRVVGEAQNRPLAGSIQGDWQIADSKVAIVDSVTDGVAKIVAQAAGKTDLKVIGGGFERTITVEVAP